MCGFCESQKSKQHNSKKKLIVEQVPLPVDISHDYYYMEIAFFMFISVCALGNNFNYLIVINTISKSALNNTSVTV